MFDNNNMVPLHAIYKFGIAQAVPVGGRIGYEELSEKTGLDEVNLRRFLRHAMTDRVCEISVSNAFLVGTWLGVEGVKHLRDS